MLHVTPKTCTIWNITRWVMPQYNFNLKFNQVLRATDLQQTWALRGTIVHRACSVKAFDPGVNLSVNTDLEYVIISSAAVDCGYNSSAFESRAHTRTGLKWPVISAAATLLIFLCRKPECLHQTYSYFFLLVQPESTKMVDEVRLRVWGRKMGKNYIIIH